jgi:hypothetical protein
VRRARDPGEVDRQGLTGEAGVLRGHVGELPVDVVDQLLGLVLLAQGPAGEQRLLLPGGKAPPEPPPVEALASGAFPPPQAARPVTRASVATGVATRGTGRLDMATPR